MDEYYNVQGLDEQDTIPEVSSEEVTNIEDGEKCLITPDNDNSLSENIVRDAEDLKVQKSASEKVKASEPFVSVQYNHKNRDFTKEEAINFIQKGMHTEALRAKLEYLAKAQGTDVNSLVEKIVMAPETAYRIHLEQLYGKDSQDVEIGMAIYREKQNKEYKQLMAEHENNINEQKKTESVNSRLAEEYLVLKSEMPDVPDYSELPDSVIIEAAEGKRDLYSAYLHYLHKEKKEIDAAKKTQQAADTASSGRMGGNNADGVTSAERSFLSGLWER